MYDRYIDDSNQAAEKKKEKKVIIDPNYIIQDEMEDKRMARVLKDIANNVMPGIVMEEDFPSRNMDGKMPILDMKVWTDETDGFIM